MKKRDRLQAPVRTLIGLSTVVAALGVASCYESVPTEPTKRMLPWNPISADLSPDTKSVGLPSVPGSKVLIHVYPYPEGVIVEATISGTIHITSSSLARFHPEGDYDYRGYGQNGSWGTQCSVAAYFAFGISAPARGLCGSGPSDFWTDTVKVMDSVWAKRDAAILDNENNCAPEAPCHSYSNSTQALSLTPIPAELKYSASPAFSSVANMQAYYATFTTFSSAAIPSSIHGIATPKKFLERAWHKADSAGTPWPTNLTGFCGPTIMVCQMPVRESGIFWAKERVNGIDREDSVAVNCLTGDPILDNIMARMASADAVKATNPLGPPSNRIEKVFAIILYTGPPSYYDAVQVTTSLADRCMSKWDAISPTFVGPGGRVVAYVHTHPTTANVTTYTCPNDPLQIVRTAGPGLSADDDSARKIVNKYMDSTLASFGWSGVPFYAIDNENVYRLKPTDSLARSADATNTFKWKTGRCAWARPTTSQAPANASYFIIQ